MEDKVARTGLFSIFLGGVILAAGCSDSGDDYDDIDERNAEIVENLIEAGFSEEDIDVREASVFGEELTLIESEMQVFVDGDMHVTLEASREMLDQGAESFRHWRTPNLINNKNGTVCLVKITTAQGAYSSYALTNNMKTGINRARTNFNNVSGLPLPFKVGQGKVNGNGQFSHTISGCTYSIYFYKVSGGAGGSAGFPSGGKPYNQVRLNSGLAGHTLNVFEHVATHEIGHAIGLRHTDWKTRASCGQNTNEGKSGAVQISGTANQTTNSLMASCFSSGSNGEFQGEDEEALGKLY
ncbi:MAG: M57 family metalloprotease [Myxococcota bacterium]